MPWRQHRFHPTTHCFKRLGRGNPRSALGSCPDGLSIPLGRDHRFLHDRVQEAAYSLIPEDLRADAHLRIGRLIAAATPPDKLEERIFDIVNQLNRSVRLVTSAAEQLQIAELNLIAGRRARASSAYKSALAYLAAGEALLSEEQWERHYRLRFSLALNRAECEFVTGDFYGADERLSRLRPRAIGSTDLAAVACLRIALYTTDRPSEHLESNGRLIPVRRRQMQGGRHRSRWPPLPSGDISNPLQFCSRIS
jgi:hypothetical protein